MRVLAFATVSVLIAVLATPLLVAASQAVLNPPHSDSGIDTDGDFLFNFLEVRVELNVTVGGPFAIFVDLYNGTGFYIATGLAFPSLPPGLATVPVTFTGVDLYNEGSLNVSYQADISVYDDTFTLNDFGTHMTMVYNYTDFDPPMATFAPPHSDQGIDTDGDLLNNTLRVNAIVNVTQAGSYDVFATAYDSFSVPITNVFVTVFLGPGNGQAIPLNFPGWRFRAHGVDGPFTVDMFLYETFGPFLDSDTHTTAGYPAASFDTPPASLTPPHSDQGIDTDGDGLFNVIEIGVSVQVDEPGDFNIGITFWDATNFTWLGSNTTTVTLPVGPQSAPVWKTTITMLAQGIDGPYNVDIDLMDTSFNTIDQGSHYTTNYSTTQFDPLPVTFAPPHADAGEDRDAPPDGLFNVLRVDVSVLVNDTGTFILGTDLWDLNMTTVITSDFRFVSFASTGPQTVSVYFPGPTIRQSGIDGPYFVNMGLIDFLSFTQLDTGNHTTQAYNATDFQNVVPATLSGNVSDSVTSAGIQANIAVIDYQNMVAMSTLSGPSGAYSVPVYQGDWVILSEAIDYDTALNSVTLAGNTTLDIAMMPSTPDLFMGAATFGPWDTLDLGFTGFLETDVILIRWQIDWVFGNRDQTLSQAEWDTFLQTGFFMPPAPANSTWDSLLVDSLFYELVPGSDSFQFFDAPGPIDSTTPLRLTTAATYTNATIAPSATHTIDGNITYDTSFEDFRFNIVLPPGFVLTSYWTATNITVSGVGSGNVTIEPDQDPNPFDSIDYAWIQLNVSSTDATAPVVSSATATPNPVVSGNPVNFAATASDDTAVSSVRLQVWDPSGGLVVNATMTDGGGGSYTYGPLVVGALGNWTFTATAADDAGNTASRSGSFRVIELTAPTISSHSAAPSPQEYGQSVLISANVTDNTAVATVTVEVRNPSGGLLGNFTMAFNATSGRYEYSVTSPNLGNHTYTIWAKDTSDNYAAASGTFVIRDTTAPVLTNAGATPSPVEVGSSVRISVNATDAAGFGTVRVEVRDPSNAVVGNFSMTLSGGVYQYDYTPTDTGTYTFLITATDLGGNARTASGSFVSRDTTDPVANAGPDQTVTAGTTVTFTSAGSSDNHGIVNYTWTFTEGSTTIRLYGAAPTHTFNAAGTYQVNLTVTDEAGNTDSDIVTITVQTTGPGTPAGTPPWVWGLLIVIIIGALLAVYMLRRRKKAVGAPSPPPPAEPMTSEEPPPSTEEQTGQEWPPGS